MTLAHQIAERIHALRYEDISNIAPEWISHAFIDTIACSLAGMAEAAPRIVMGIPGVADAIGPATVGACDCKTSVLDATLINGTASHALDYNDVSGVMGGHPSAILVPSMIAPGESLGSSGCDLVLAYVVGYETECRIARGVHFHHYDKGWHPTATRALLPRVKAFAHADMPADGRCQWGAEVVAYTNDGRRLASRIDNYERCGPGGQMMSRGRNSLTAPNARCRKRRSRHYSRSLKPLPKWPK
jgi:hypothetical protein